MPIEVDPCVPIDVTAFQRQLAIELETAPQAGDLVRTEATARVAVGCSGDQISVEVTDPVAHKAWGRKVDLRDVAPRARTRLMALSVAELLLASWLEVRVAGQSTRTTPVERKPEPAQAPSQLPPASTTSSVELPTQTSPPAQARAEPGAKPTQAAQSRAQAEAQATTKPAQAAEAQATAKPTQAAEPRAQTESQTQAAPDASEPALQLGAAGEVLGFTSSFTPIFGGGLHVALPLVAAWALHIAAQGGYGSLSGDLAQQPAQLHVTAASVALALCWLARGGGFELSIGTGARLGLLHLAGTQTDLPVKPARAFAPWVGPLASASVSYGLSAGLRATLRLEAGLLAVRVRALAPDDNTVTELHGPWLLGSLGLDGVLGP